MSDKLLRSAITGMLQKRGICCTWWFKFSMGYDTPAIRRELERMEREGLVVSDRNQRNNTKWELVR